MMPSASIPLHGVATALQFCHPGLVEGFSGVFIPWVFFSRFISMVLLRYENGGLDGFIPWHQSGDSSHDELVSAGDFSSMSLFYPNVQPYLTINNNSLLCSTNTTP
jgi:hypothetical protein